MLQPLLDEPFAKMPAALVDTATRKVREFVLAAGEPQLAEDAGMVLGACIGRIGERAVREFLQPLLEAAETSVKALVGAALPAPLPSLPSCCVLSAMSCSLLLCAQSTIAHAAQARATRRRRRRSG